MAAVHSLISQLIRLQELVVANMQKKASMPSAKLDGLQRSINTLTDALPQSVKGHFYRLLQKHPEAVVPVLNGACVGCGMSLTKNLINTLLKGETLHRCPNCARFLYYPEHAVERERMSRVYGEVKKTGIARYTTPKLMIANLKGSTPQEVLSQLCKRMSDEAFVDDFNVLLERSQEREQIVSTTNKYGMAFPHVRGVEGGGLVLALGINHKGIKFGGTGRMLTRIFFFTVIPTAASGFYIKMLSNLSSVFQEKEARDLLLAARTDEALWKALLKTTRKIFT